MRVIQVMPGVVPNLNDNILLGVVITPGHGRSGMIAQGKGDLLEMIVKNSVRRL